MSFIAQYGLFAAKLTTLIVGILVTIAGALYLIGREKRKGETVDSPVTVSRINEKYDAMRHTLEAKVLDKEALKQAEKTRKHQEKDQTEDDKKKKRVFVIDFDGDIRASAVSALREEVTAVLTFAKPEDEVFVTVSSGGGMVNTYGLAASQLSRIRDRGIPLTIAVDKIAASGGYMMACVGNQILAAPFAILGSIGVVAQMPNFNRLLKKHDIDYEQITAGEYKRTLTVFGENTEKGREKFKDDLEEIHQLFKDFVKQYRPQVELEQVATGEYWFGTRALELQLVDTIRTSDDYLLDQAKEASLYRVKHKHRKSFSEKLSSLFNSAVDRMHGRQGPIA